MYGNDLITGGADNDMIFGQLGDDELHGDFNVAGTGTQHSYSADSDGDDYIEGNGGRDLIFGNLGQDDIIGGSSDLYGLTTWDARPDGRDIIFGGSHNDDHDEDESEGLAKHHNDQDDEKDNARDADVILGNNASIFRPLDVNGDLLVFEDDGFEGPLRVIPRAVKPLDHHEHNDQHDTHIDEHDHDDLDDHDDFDFHDDDADRNTMLWRFSAVWSRRFSAQSTYSPNLRPVTAH